MLDWVSDLDSKLEIKNISDHVISIAKARNILMKDILELADREVDGTPQCTFYVTPLSLLLQLTVLTSARYLIVSC